MWVIYPLSRYTFYMATISYKIVPPEFDQTYKKTLQSGDRFVSSVIKRKLTFTSRNSKKGLTQKSLMPSLSVVWNNLDTVTKNNWNSAGAREGLTGWKEFLKDTALRRANGGEGFSTPQDDRQCNVGRITLQSPATGIALEQLHPNNYYVLKKVRGTKSQYNPQLITEHVFLPLTIRMSYRADLQFLNGGEVVGAGNFFAGLSRAGEEVTGGGVARFYVEVYSHYQGRDLKTVLELPFNCDGNWHIESATLTGVFGVVRGYTAIIELDNCNGDFYFDNVSIEHSGLNWCRDPHCNNISQSFTGAFIQIPKAWDVDNLQDGATYHSFYYGMM